MMPSLPLDLQSEAGILKIVPVGRSQAQRGRVLPHWLEGPGSFCRFPAKLQLIAIAVQDGRLRKGWDRGLH